MHPVLRGPTALLLTAIFSVTSLTTGCKSSQDATPAASQDTSQAAPPTQDAGPTQAATLSLDDLVAPIALYPDQLLAQVLTASTTPQEVLDGGNWILQNQNLKGDSLVNAAKDAGFGPSMQYLMNFPQVVDNMCQEMDWTTQLGQAFQSDQQGVMEAVQRKRGQAQKVGNLVSSPQMTVATKTENGQQYVEIKPTDPKVVYVPQYNPVTVYVQSPPPVVVSAPVTTTTTPQSTGVSTGTAAGIGLLSFGVGMLIGAAISSNNHYYPYPAWGYRSIYYRGGPYYPPPYRPVYPGYRPAYGYHPPPNYRWTQVNNNINININNNYYNKFNNQNRPSTLPANNASTLPANNRAGGNPNVNTLNNNRAGQGNNTYQGARPSTSNQKPGSSMANAVPRNQQLAAPANQPTNMNRANPSNGAPATNRTGNASAANTRPGTGNSGSMNRGGATPATQPTNRAGTSPTTQPTNRTGTAPATQPTNRGGDRGYANATRPATGSTAPTSRPSPSSPTQNRGNGAGAFSGGTARADRADSSRGRSSMGAPAGGGRGGRSR